MKQLNDSKSAQFWSKCSSSSVTVCLLPWACKVVLLLKTDRGIGCSYSYRSYLKILLLLKSSNLIYLSSDLNHRLWNSIHWGQIPVPCGFVVKYSNNCVICDEWTHLFLGNTLLCFQMHFNILDWMKSSLNLSGTHYNKIWLGKKWHTLFLRNARYDSH